MPPKARLESHLVPNQLKSLYRHSPDRVEARRWHLLYLVSQQWTIKQAADVVGFSYDYAKTIVRRYNAEGPDSVCNRSKKRASLHGRSLLSLEQLQELYQVLRHPAPDGKAWTGPKVARWIASKTGKKRVWPQRGWEYLKRFQAEYIDD
ncbi:MAG: helix-turn-helix domain-containing protein [Elainellaceae cyanobacterium]